MLDKLNEEQINKLGICKDKWIEIGLKTGPIDREAAVVAVNKAYTAAGLTPPESIVFCSSPLDMDEKIGLLLKDLKDFYIWKVFVNDKNFISKWMKNREEFLKTIPRPTMSK